MDAGQKINLLSPISKQTNGVILVFSAFANGNTQNYEFQPSFVVPKWLVSKHPSKGSRFSMVEGLFSIFCTKYLYISDTEITGHENNIKVGTAASGVKYNNRQFVLRYVIGF